MKLSIQQSPIGKPEKKALDVVKWTNGWQAVDIAPLELVNHVTTGRPFAVAQYQGGVRKLENFLVSELIAVDVDENPTTKKPLTEAEKDRVLDTDIVAKYAFAVIQSASSEEGAYKLRVFFHLSEAITDAEEYVQLTRVVYGQVPYADAHTKDGARGFFGGQPGRKADFLRSTHRLPVDWLKSLIPAAPKPKTYTLPAGHEAMDKAREALRYITPEPGYDTWLKVLMAIKAEFGDAGLPLALEWSEHVSQPGEIESKFKSFRGNGTTIGTLYRIAKQNGWVSSFETLPAIAAPMDMDAAPEDGDLPASNSLTFHLAAERRLLGAIIQHPVLFEDASLILKDDETVFYQKSHQVVWGAVSLFNGLGKVWDKDYLIEHLRSSDPALDAANIVSGLIAESGKGIHIPTYAKTILECAGRRRGMHAAAEAHTMYLTDKRELDAINKEVEVLFESTDTEKETGGFLSMHLPAQMARIERVRNGEETPGISSGFVDLDVLLTGFYRGDLIYIAGRPSMGKTAIMLNVAFNMALEGLTVAFFSLEMTKEQLINRLLAMAAGIDSDKLRTGNLTDDEWRLVQEAQVKLSKLKIYLDDTSSLGQVTLANKARQIMRRYGLHAVFVDYIGLMTYQGETRGMNPAQVLGAISHSLKALAMRLNIPVISGAQLNREVAGRTDKAPVLTDLRDSGELEQDADVVIMLHRDDYYNEASERPNETDLLVRKHRNGKIGRVILFFRKHLTRFVDIKTTHIDLAAGVKETTLPGGRLLIEEI